ncbi:actinodefensin-associated protein B [Actinomyces sp.]|uniref:actinodefensin-associated protein B n=1 Tax=Actinomyces sp. TaxID=29317 RepID=UPI0026DD77F7|nr:actinodefensin-associated protein B [Actinomyces sp.]MDO4901059.1 actinodefensin-associated protein B [Actinomyces sp.]
MSLTHLENGGWAVADLRRLSVYEFDEETGALIAQALRGDLVPMDSPVLQEAVASGVLIEADSNGTPGADPIDSEQ